MEKAAIIEGLKKESITVLDRRFLLSDSMVTRIDILDRKPQFTEEEVITLKYWWMEVFLRLRGP